MSQADHKDTENIDNKTPFLIGFSMSEKSFFETAPLGRRVNFDKEIANDKSSVWAEIVFQKSHKKDD